MKIIETKIDSFFLGYEKKITVVLPKDYSQDLSYAVLYMQDGQNLFYDEKSYGNHSWKVLESIPEIYPDLIVVGIENQGEKRAEEYSPWKSDNPYLFLKEGKGEQYGRFFMEELIPYIESNYAVKRDRTQRFLVGSSLGAFISVYLSCNYPCAFSKVGCFSLASFFNQKEFDAFIKSTNIDSDYYISVGTRETSLIEDLNFPKIYLDSSESFFNSVKDKTNSVFKVYPDFYHNEEAWSIVLKDFLKWIKKE